MTRSDGADAVRPRPGGIDAVTVLTVYLVLLLAVPSSYTISALGSAGKPAALWALGATLWWAASRVQRFVPIRSDARAVKIGIFAFGGAVLLSYAVAMLRGLSPEEVSPADGSLLRLLGWVGIALVASDGIDDRDRFRTLLRRVVIAGTLMAVLGLLQFVTGQSLLDWLSIPGFSSDVSGLAGVQSRGGFVRASGTAIHPLEYGTVLCVAFPIAVSLALSDTSRLWLPRWLPVFIIGAASMLAVSRSTLIGLAAGVALLVPGWSRGVKVVFAIVSTLSVVAVGVLVPGIVGTLRGLFLGIGGDASTGSRVEGIDSTAEMLARFPVSGKGFGTFLPVYHILDNQYLLLTIETGIVGLITFLTLVCCALWSAWKAKRLMTDSLDRALVQSVLASTAAAAVLLAFFDGFSFPMSAGLMFFLIGLCGGTLRLALRERRAAAIRMPLGSPLGPPRPRSPIRTLS
jgi:O-antigen ligase